MNKTKAKKGAEEFNAKLKAFYLLLWNEDWDFVILCVCVHAIIVNRKAIQFRNKPTHKIFTTQRNTHASLWQLCFVCWTGQRYVG